MTKFLDLRLVLGFLGVPGLPSASYVGYLMGDSANPTMERYFKDRGKRGSPVSSNLGAVSSVRNGWASISNNAISKWFKQRTSPCFEKIFGVQDVNTILYAFGSSQYAEQVKYEPNLTVLSNTSSKAEGCAYINFSFGPQEEAGTRGSFSFKAVLTARKGDIGLALFADWTFDKSNKSNKKISLIYSLLFMSKENNKGSVKGGYSGVDNKLTDRSKIFQTDIYYSSSSSSSSDSVTEKPYIVAPGSQVWSDGNSDLQTTLSKHYAGLGTESSEGEGTEEFFKSIKVQKDSSTNGEILGLANYDFSQQDAGYNKVHITMNNGNWQRTSTWGEPTSYNIKHELKKGFSHFENKKGKGTTFDDYCGKFKDLQTKREFNPDGQDIPEMLRGCFS